MNCGVSKARTGRSRLKPLNTSQKELLDAVASTGAELPPSRREKSLQSGDLAGDTKPVQTRKRRRDATTKSDPVPGKRARLTRTDTQQPGVEGEKAEPVDKTTLQQPKPKPPYASFLEDFVDPVHPNRRAAPVHTFVSEWLESVGSDREKHCRSDSHLQRSDGDSISRQLTRSAPEMGYTRDADGFAVPPTPASTRSYQATEDSASSTASVRHPSYRHNNLNSNKIHIRDASAQLPDYLSSHLEGVRAERDSPGPSSEQIRGYLHGLEILDRGCTEANVESFLEDTVFPKDYDATYGRRAGLESAKSSLMSSHLIPNNPESQFRVSGPKPDLLYGYSSDLRDGAFTESQFLAQEVLHPRNARFAEATAQGLRFPFFAIEIKAAGGTRGDLWVATNQCAGASSACLNAAYQLNTLLPKHPGVQRVDNLSYCVAVDNNTAQLYISWKEDDLNYYLQRVDAFLLSRPEDFKGFRKQVRNILDWGKGTRLEQIKDALDVILEENRQRASEAAKSRQPPSDGSATSSGKRRKSSRGNSSRSDRMQGQSGETNEPYWDEEPSFPPDHTTSQDDGLALADYLPEDDQQDGDGGLAPAEYLPDDQQDQDEGLAQYPPVDDQQAGQDEALMGNTHGYRTRSKRHSHSPSSNLQSGKKHHRGKKSQVAGPRKGKAKASSPDTGEDDVWEWNDEEQAYRTWNSYNKRWEYWDEEAQSRMYKDGGRWEWAV
ncbi:hypothetical protein B0T16DRAFT_451044 [Cercophora newfieldiana]|uniref:DUF7924 domain-containing protein n=1 Tax=Cercophora newfieldiana TaxID=92897 RepID=A0AA39YNZ2_9PEZI|nr:hypothetical protein B0T16DRAFT_451044 [Cercophora newfieldiana]